AAAARVDLRLDDADGSSELRGDLAGFLRRLRHLAARNPHAELREQCLSLELVDVHLFYVHARALTPAQAARTFSSAPTSSATWLADTSTCFFSSAVSGISITFSTPPAPICTGTPR